MIINIKNEMYQELLHECVEAQKLLLATEEEIKDLSVRDLLDRHWTTLQHYFDYLYSFGGTYKKGEFVYCVDFFEFITAVSLVGFVCPLATALVQKCFTEPIV